MSPQCAGCFLRPAHAVIFRNYYIGDNIIIYWISLNKFPKTSIALH